MDLLTRLSEKTEYSDTELQLLVGAWVASRYVDGRLGTKKKKKKISTTDGDVSEDDYTKQSLYSLLYAIYRSVGEIRTPDGKPWEMTFNTWGYAWPETGFAREEPNPDDPQRFGRNAYTGLFSHKAIMDYLDERDGRIHVVEMGCGTGAGAHHLCKNIIRSATYEAIDMQSAAIATCRRKFVPELGGRLMATHADATRVGISDASVDAVAVCETHVTEYTGRVTEEDARFFRTAIKMIKPGGFFTWGNAIPDPTWEPCFEVLEKLGMKRVQVLDVTEEAVKARDLDRARVDAFVDDILNHFHAFKLPNVGSKRRREAELALKNFYRNPDTRLYEKMTDGTDSYKVALFQKPE